MRNINQVLRLFFILIIVVFSFQISAQEAASKRANLSIDLVISGGTSTMMNLSKEHNSHVNWYGQFENKRPRFTQVGFDLRKKLRRNTLKTGIHLGTWSYMIEGHKYLPLAGFFPVFELSPETITEKVKFQRLSIPVSYLIEAKNPSGLRIDHELGLYTDLYYYHNINQIRQFLSGAGRYENPGINPFSIRNNNQAVFGLRLFYGISLDLNDKISIGSSIKMGGFIIGRYYPYDYPIEFDFSYNYERYNFRIFEFGLSASYNIF